MLAVDRLRKSASGAAGAGLRRQSTPLPPAVEPRTSSLVRKPSAARSESGPSTPSRHAPPPPTTATEIIHLRDDPVVVRPEVVAIQVSRTSSSTWAAAATDSDNGVGGGGVASSLTYESFRGPPQSPPAAAERRDGAGDGERTPTNEIDQVASARLHGSEEIATTTTSHIGSPRVAVNAAPVPSSARHAGDEALTTTSHDASPRAAVTSSPPTATQVSSPRAASSTATSPTSPRPRPQIAPKPRLELRQRRASAGESPAAAATSPTASPTSPSSATPGLAMLASVMAAASSQRMSERCRLQPSSPSTSRRSAADAQVDDRTSAVAAVSVCARPSSASAVSRTASNSGGAGCSQRAPAGTGSSPLGTDKKVDATTSSAGAAASPARTASVGSDSPRRSVPPPVPPKHAHAAFSADKRSADVSVQSSVVACSPSTNSPASAPLPVGSTGDRRPAGAVAQPSVVARSLSSTSSAAASCSAVHAGSTGARSDSDIRSVDVVQSSVVARSPSASQGASCSPVHSGSAGGGPSDSATLPFANENVGTIRQRGAAVSAEQPPAAAATSVNADVTTTTGNPGMNYRYLLLCL